MVNKLIEKDKNKVGTVFSFVQHQNGKFGVYILKGNYAGHVRGGISLTWCYCGKNLDEQTARELFIKKLKGRAR